MHPQHVKLSNGSEATKQFVHSSAPLYTTYYFFNVTNPQEVMSGTAVPVLKQIGPYAYQYVPTDSINRFLFPINTLLVGEEAVLARPCLTQTCR